MDNEMEKYNHITIDVIEQDIRDTQRELDQYKKELDAIKGNPVENKVSVYMTEGKIKQRVDFLQFLNSILDYRNNKNK